MIPKDFDKLTKNEQMKAIAALFSTTSCEVSEAKQFLELNARDCRNEGYIGGARRRRGTKKKSSASPARQTSAAVQQTAAQTGQQQPTAEAVQEAGRGDIYDLLSIVVLAGGAYAAGSLAMAAGLDDGIQALLDSNGIPSLAHCSNEAQLAARLQATYYGYQDVTMCQRAQAAMKRIIIGTPTAIIALCAWFGIRNPFSIMASTARDSQAYLAERLRSCFTRAPPGANPPALVHAAALAIDAQRAANNGGQQAASQVIQGTHSPPRQQGVSQARGRSPTARTSNTSSPRMGMVPASRMSMGAPSMSMGTSSMSMGQNFPPTSRSGASSLSPIVQETKLDSPPQSPTYGPRSPSQSPTTGSLRPSRQNRPTTPSSSDDSSSSEEEDTPPPKKSPVKKVAVRRSSRNSRQGKGGGRKTRKHKKHHKKRDKKHHTQDDSESDDEYPDKHKKHHDKRKRHHNKKHEDPECKKKGCTVMPNKDDGNCDEIKKETVDYEKQTAKHMAQYIGFMSKFKEDRNKVFKVKDFANKRSTGARCDQSSKAAALQILKNILEYSGENPIHKESLDKKKNIQL